MIIFISKKNWLSFTVLGMTVIFSPPSLPSEPHTFLLDTLPPDPWHHSSPKPSWLEQGKVSRPSLANDSWTRDWCSKNLAHSWPHVLQVQYGPLVAIFHRVLEKQRRQLCREGRKETYREERSPDPATPRRLGEGTGLARWRVWVSWSWFSDSTRSGNTVWPWILWETLSQ